MATLNVPDKLLYESLENEQGGIKVYEAAIRCAVRDDLKEEWTKYLAQTREHEQILRDLLGTFGLEPDHDTPGRTVVRHLGESLVMAMELARKVGSPDAAQIVAAECVVNAETKCHMMWHLVGEFGRKTAGAGGEALLAAYKKVEDEEDEHVYHTKGWARELWIEALGMPALLPPPEEIQDAGTAIGAARAEASRELILGMKQAESN